MKALKKLKLSKTSWIFLSIGLFVVIVGSLSLTLSQQLREKNELNEELGVLNMRINKIYVEQLRQRQGELKQQLDESATYLTVAKDVLRQPVESIDVTDEFFATAYSCGMEVVSISSSDVKNEPLDSIDFSVININALVTGSLSDLITFVTTLNNDFTTGIVKSAQVSIKESDAAGFATASLAMVVYTYQGE